MNRLVILLLAVLTACTIYPLPPLVASDVVVTRQMPGMQMIAAYLSLANN